VVDAVSEPGTRHLADFQVTPDGDVSAFSSTLPLVETAANAGHTELYRYSGTEFDCISCNPTGSTDEGDGTLSHLGLGLTDDGRVFFNSAQALAPRDGDEKIDVYEWEGEGAGNCQTAGGCVGLVSTGTSRFDAKLITASSDATDAFFFTRDTLVPQDENGILTKIYDARELGGFPYIPPPVPCKASDECHGPSSAVSPPPNIGTFKGSRGNYTVPDKCKKGLIRKHGKCVKKHHRSKHHRTHRHG
jgi:hypothetical protein